MLQSSGVAMIHHPSAPSRDEVSAIAANLPEYAPANLESRDGDIGFVGVAAVSLVKVAQAVRPKLVPVTTKVPCSYAVHVAIVEVDRETGLACIDKYAVSHDSGVVVCPMGSAVSSAKRSSMTRMGNC
jgi:CO/xanthine dehydrogenase Mo-binding subunit